MSAARVLFACSHNAGRSRIASAFFAQLAEPEQARSVLADGDRLTGWMFQIARSAIAERGRDRMRHPIVAEPTAEPVAVVDDTEAGATHALSKCLTIFVARLPSPYREAITLVELDGTSRAQRGPAQLRQRLEECCEIAVDARWGRHRLHATPYGVLPFAGI